jgi:hypothetical protein
MEAGLRSVTSSLRDTDWSRLDHDSEYRKICPHREHACLDLLFGVLADDLRLEFDNQPVSVVFDNDYGNTKSMFKVYEAWRERTAHAGFHIMLKGDLPWDSVPLQCADMVAGLLRINPLSLAMLADRIDSPYDDDPISDIAGMALSYGRGAMWSSSIAEKVEKLIRR